MLINIRDTIRELIDADTLMFDVKVDRKNRCVAVVKTQYRRVVVKAVSGERSRQDDIRGICFLSAAGLPVQQVLAEQDRVAANGETVHIVVLSYIQGESLSPCSPWEAQVGVGKALRRIHALHPPVWVNSRVWGDRFLSWLQADMEWWCRGNGGDDSKASVVLRQAEALRNEMNSYEGGAILLDGRPDHFLVHHGCFSGIIDVEDLSAGDWVMDYAVLAVHAE